MANKHLSPKPKKINPNAWWYEESHGISVMHEVYSNGRHVRTDKLKIPWHKIRKALARKDRTE